MTALAKLTSLNSDAVRYGNAITAIGSIASMRLDTEDQIRAALAILDRESPNLKFHPSRLVVQAANHPAFAAAVKRAAPSRAAAEALIKELRADPKAVLRLDGTQLLGVQLRESVQKDVATIRRVGMHLASIRKGRKRSEPVNDFGLSNAPSGQEWIFYILPANVVIAGYIEAASSIGSLILFMMLLAGIQECMAAQSLRRTQCVATARLQIPPNLDAEVECNIDWTQNWDPYVYCLQREARRLGLVV